MHINMLVEAKKTEVLEAVRKNREDHQAIVKEARSGYMSKAREALAARMNDLERGELVSLAFALVLPQDYTKDYDAAIRMLELHQSDTVELDDQMVRCLVLNEWGWMDQFIGSTAAYSATAASRRSSR